MQELTRLIGVVREKDGRKMLEEQGKEIELIGAGDCVDGLVYRIVGTLENNVLRVEHARKLEGVDLQVYEKALRAALGKSI